MVMAKSIMKVSCLFIEECGRVDFRLLIVFYCMSGQSCGLVSGVSLGFTYTVFVVIFMHELQVFLLLFFDSRIRNNDDIKVNL
jgi:hypothetical protein